MSNEEGMDAAFIELEESGALVGATNCRTLSGTWIETGSEILFNNFSADGECSEDVASDLDSRIITVLGDGFGVEIEGDRLTVTAQGGEGLTFRSEG